MPAILAGSAAAIVGALWIASHRPASLIITTPLNVSIAVSPSPFDPVREDTVPTSARADARAALQFLQQNFTPLRGEPEASDLRGRS